MVIWGGDRPPGAFYERFLILRRRNWFIYQVNDGDYLVGDAPGGSALGQRGRPPVAMMRYYPYSGMLPAQVIPRRRIRPHPQGAGLAEGGLHETRKPAECRPSGPPSNQNQIAPKIFPAILIFVRKNLAVQTFDRKFFGFFNFQTEKNTAGKISSHLFLRFSTFDRKIFRFLKFHGQKKYAVFDPMPLAMEYDLRRGSELVAELTTFFPTFAPDFFGFFNFQSKNF